MQVDSNILSFLEDQRAREISRVDAGHATMLRLFRMCQSPMEQRFLYGIVNSIEFENYEPDERDTPFLACRNFCEPWVLGYSVNIYPQKIIQRDRVSHFVEAIGHFRADFLFELYYWWHEPGRWETHMNLIVEIDGHDFHERTKEQARRDKSRDRYLTAQGYTVFRYTGSEVYRNLDEVVSEVNLALFGKAIDVAKERGLRFS